MWFCIMLHRLKPVHVSLVRPSFSRTGKKRSRRLRSKVAGACAAQFRQRDR